MPGMGGTNGRVPVAITKWAPSRRVPSSSSTAWGLTNRARASKTSTPSPVNRSTESLGAIWARRSRMCSKTRWNRNAAPWHRVRAASAVADALDQFRGGNQGLGRHASGIETIATHFGGLHQCDASSETRGARRHHETRRARPDDDDVVAALAALISHVLILHGSNGTLFRRDGRPCGPGPEGGFPLHVACLVNHRPPRGIAGCWVSTKRGAVQRSGRSWWRG